jgi:hypothetical protein
VVTVGREAPLLIVADTYAAAWTYAREHDLGPERGRWIYVSQLHNVQGRRGNRWVRVRTGDLCGQALSDRLDVVDYLFDRRLTHGFEHVEERERS